MALTIMVVDDEPAVLRFMKSVIVPLGHEILTLTDSRQAADRMEKQKVDVVFVDMRMPDLDGIELTRRIRASKPNGETPIVMLTGVGEVEALRQALKEGVTFYLNKPITPVRVTSLLTAMQRSNWKERRHSARLPIWINVNCRRDGDDQKVVLRSLSIAERGMALEPWPEFKVDQELCLDFAILEIRASFKVRTRVVHNDGKDSMGVQFIDLSPEDCNAIQLYIIGRMKE